jgi:hypothetical protein
MGRRAKQQQFRDPDAECVARRWRGFAAEKRFQHGINAAQPAQHGRRNAMRRGTIASFKPRWQGFECLFQWPMRFQHGIQHIARGAPGGQAGRAPWPG